MTVSPSLSPLSSLSLSLSPSSPPLHDRYDGTTRNAQGEVVHFLYGEDGLSAEWVEDQTLSTYKLTDRELEKRYGFETTRKKLKEYVCCYLPRAL